MSDEPDILTPGAQRICLAAKKLRDEYKHEGIGVTHWLVAILERHREMVEASAPGVDGATLATRLKKELAAGLRGVDLDEGEVTAWAYKRAQARNAAQAFERDVVAVVLFAYGFRTQNDSVISALPVKAAEARLAITDKSAQSPERTASLTILEKMRAMSGTRMLGEFGRDLTGEARAGRLPTMVGRETELQLLCETLCRKTKRNPVLVGAAGVGKTAIVDGFAQRIVNREVPEPLRGMRVFAVTATSLIAGAHYYGMIEKRVQGVLDEARQDGILLFIDELHTIIATGPGDDAVHTRSISNMLKPALARGEIACIGATTDEEYRRFIEPDTALERRFQPIRVGELSEAQTLEVLSTLRDEYAAEHNLRIPDESLRRTVELAARFMPNRYFPDKATDLLEQTVSFALMQSEERIAPAHVEMVCDRMVGVPTDLNHRLEGLRESLIEKSLASEEEAQGLCGYLSVTMRGLNLTPTRPNAVVLLAEDAGTSGKVFCETVSETLYETKERVVTIDFGRMTHAGDISQLIGVAPGLVGQHASSPLTHIAQKPWCVIHALGLDACHPSIRDAFAHAVTEGSITDVAGKRVFLSDAIIVITADSLGKARRRVGFRAEESEDSRDEIQTAASTVLGVELARAIDVVLLGGEENTGADGRKWLKERLLRDLAMRFRRQDVHLHWDKSLIDALTGRLPDARDERERERIVDEWLSPALVPYYAPQSQPLSLTVRCEAGEITVGKVAAHSIEEHATPVFESEAQGVLFEQVNSWLKEVFGEATVSLGGDEPLINIQALGLRLRVEVALHSNGQLMVVAQCLVATGVEPTAELLWRLMQINRKEMLGRLGIDERGNLSASAALPGDGITKEGLAGLVNIVAGVAKEYGSQLAARWGGSLHLNKLAVES